MPLHRKVASAAAALTAASLFITACQDDSAGQSPPAPTTSVQPAPSASTPAPTAGTGEEPPVSRPTTAGTQPVIADGRWPAYVTAVGDRTVTMDLVEFLTGDRAIREWQNRYPDSEDETPPNDYFIVNDNPKKRTLPLASTVSVKVVDGGATADVEVGVAGLQDRLLHTLFWLTVKNGEVVLVQQQFLP